MAAADDVPTLEKYWASVEEFCGNCRRTLGDDFVSLIVVGSLSVGDALPGWSDVDACLIVTEPSERVRRAVARLVRSVTERYPFFATDRGSKFTVFVYTRREFIEGGDRVSFLTLWDVRRHGVVACGEDLRPLLTEPPLDLAWVDRHVDWMIDFLAREREAPPRWKWVNSVGFILSAARAAVLKASVYAKRKDDIAKEITTRYPQWAGTLASAMEHRRRWPAIPVELHAVEDLYSEAMDFLHWVRDLP